MSGNFEQSMISVKKPKDDKPLTKKEADEWVKCASDFWYFATTYCYVAGPKGKILFEPRGYQIDMLDCVMRELHSVLCAPRQCGKSATFALYCLWNIIFTPDFTVGITSFTNANVVDLIRRCKYSMEALPDFLKPPVKVYNTKEIILTNNSIIYGQVTSENALRGRTNQLVLCDEFSYVNQAVAEEFYTALMPSLTADGENSKTRVIFCSTPNGSSGLYAQLAYGAMAGNNGFSYHQVDHTRIEGRSPEFYAAMEKKLGKNRVLSEYMCHFISDKGTLVNSRSIEAIKTSEPTQSLGDLDLFTDSFSNRKIMIACDVSDGIGQDSHAMQIFDVDTLEQIGEYSNNVMSQSYYAKEIIKAIKYFYSNGASEVYYTVENNGTGAGVIRLLENSVDPYLQKATFLSDIDGNKAGIVMTKTSKAKGCALFKDLVEMTRLKIHSEKLKVQMKFFIKSGSTFKAESGTHDDLVMACILMMLMMDILSNYEDSVFEVVSEIDDSLDGEDWGIFF